MATRKIIEIDEALCNGCGECVTSCAEGALQIVNGKAKLVKENFCDGFGACIGECPTGALRIVDRDAPEYDAEAARSHVARTGGEEAVRRFDQAAAAHGDPHPVPAAARPAFGGCPGSRMRTYDDGPAPASSAVDAGGLPSQVNPSELRQWPIQIHLVQPGAPFFRNRELVVMNTCGPLASADVHWRFLRGRSVVVGCPKLDRTEPYADKLAGIVGDPSIPRMLVVRMEVPCCGGLSALAVEAARRSGRADLEVDEITLGLDGAVRSQRTLVSAARETTERDAHECG